MPEADDIELLADYATNGSEEAFRTLVERYVNLVYSVALRHTGNPHHAQEITQAVFIILARKARSLRRGTILSGWLYQTARLTAANFLRGEIRRQQREQEAYMQSNLDRGGDVSSPSATETIWPQIAPLLDDALGKLGDADRNAIVLRFFENKNLRDVGTALGASEDAAKMRVNRALEKLRKIFSKRGVTFSTAVIIGAVSANSVQAAPATLAATVIASSAKGSALTASTLTLIKTTMKLMAWAKMKTAALVGSAVLLTASAGTIVALSGSEPPRGGLPPEVMEQLEKQKQAMHALYIEFTCKESVSNSSWESTNCAYFEGNRFYLRELHPDGDREHGDKEFTFDGKVVTRLYHPHTGIRHTLVTKVSAFNTSNPHFRYLQWGYPPWYLDGAGIYVPAFLFELKQFSALEPLVLHYLKEGDPTKVEAVGQNLRVTFQIKDRVLINSKGTNLREVRRLVSNGANTPAFVDSQVELVKRMQAMKPTRTVTFLLEAEHGYAVAEREEWTAAGEQIVRIVSEDWRHFEDSGIWLPGRCTAYYFAQPFRLDAFSKEPVLTVAQQLTLAEFGGRNIPFVLNSTAPNTHIDDQTTIVRRFGFSIMRFGWSYAGAGVIGLLIAVWLIRRARHSRKAE